jgi:hypothetical protein
MEQLPYLIRRHELVINNQISEYEFWNRETNIVDLPRLTSEIVHKYDYLKRFINNPLPTLARYINDEFCREFFYMARLDCIDGIRYLLNNSYPRLWTRDSIFNEFRENIMNLMNTTSSVELVTFYHLFMRQILYGMSSRKTAINVDIIKYCEDFTLSMSIDENELEIERQLKAILNKDRSEKNFFVLRNKDRDHRKDLILPQLLRRLYRS